MRRHQQLDRNAFSGLLTASSMRLVLFAHHARGGLDLEFRASFSNFIRNTHDKSE